MARTFTEEDEGKPVIADGQEIGILIDVEAGQAHVEPDPSIAQSLAAKLGWGEPDRNSDTYPIYEDAVAAITDNEVRLATPLKDGRSSEESNKSEEELE